MATVTVTKDNFDSLVSSSNILVLDFWASWCGPCRTFAPIFEAASDRHADVTFGKIDTEDQPELAGAFGIQSIPSTVYFRDQMPIHMQPGLIPAEGLDQLLQQIRDLDMDVVRAEMARRASEEGDSANAES